jgi:hypothetical protein
MGHISFWLNAGDVSLQRANRASIDEHRNLIDASKEVGLEINIEKTKYMLLPRHWNAG